MKANEAVSNDEIATETRAVLRPVHVANRGAEILEELHAQAVEPTDERLIDKLAHLEERYSTELLHFVLVKFGLVTSRPEQAIANGMAPAPVAERIFKRFRDNPTDFQDSLEMVLEEEKRTLEMTTLFDLQEFERRTIEELVELFMLSGNPILEEVLKFAQDLDQVFQGSSYLFNYLEHRYANYFESGAQTPEQLAVQVALDYICYREHYQLAIIADYEQLLVAGRTQITEAARGSLQ
jgi:hypothetical protein